MSNQETNYCRRRRTEVDLCWTHHYKRWGPIIGTSLYEPLHHQVRSSSSSCYRLAHDTLRECGGMASFGRRHQ